MYFLFKILIFGLFANFFMHNIFEILTTLASVSANKVLGSARQAWWLNLHINILYWLRSM